VGIVVFPNVDALDVVGPFSVLSRVTPNLHIFFISTLHSLSVFDSTFVITPTHTFHQFKPGDIDIVIVPGGFGLDGVLCNVEFLDWLKLVCEKAKWVTSVCSGALILAVAGLLKGYKATTHWASIPLLEKLKEKGLVGEVIKWHEGKPNPRYVHDGNRITSAGVSSGIDSTLAIVKNEFGIESARSIALSINYRSVEDEEVAFLIGSGDPSTIEKPLLEKVESKYKGVIEKRERIIDQL